MMGKLRGSKLYSGQALALVLVALIVISIVALALVTRNIKSEQKVNEEKRSSEAIDISSSIVNYTQNLTIDQINAGCNVWSTSNECCLTGSNIANLGSNSATFGSSFSCSAATTGEAGNSEVKVCFKRLTSFSGYQLPQDKTLSIPLLSNTYPNTCNINLKFSSLSGGTGAIVMRKIYATKNNTTQPQKYKDSTPDDIEIYSFGSYVTNGGSLKVYDSVNGLNVNLGNKLNPYGGTPADFPIYEIRLTAIGGTFNVDFTDPTTCITTPIYYRVTASANCNGDFRSEYYYKPISPSSLSIFDYTIFNKNGDLKYVSN